MNHTERAFLFDCQGDELVGIVTLPQASAPPEIGLLIVVGGPQYRVGSHRLFVRLARRAAAQGMPAMRFDYRGMGDALGEMRTFESVDDDLRAAVDAFLQEVPTLKQVVLWGLCDGASASCLYAPQDPRVGGLILVNPWVHTEEGAAVTRLRHYYVQRLFSAALWRKVLSGQLPSLAPLTRLLGTVIRSRLDRLLGRSAPQRVDSSAGLPLPQRTGAQLLRSGVPTAVALSDDDKVAREFEDQAMPTADWQQAMSRQFIGLAHLQQADHTVTSPEAREQLCELSVRWAREIASGQAARPVSPRA
jgi:exosortase A-associated hydrolase 1